MTGALPHPPHGTATHPTPRARRLDDGLQWKPSAIERLASGDLDEAAFMEWVQERLD